MPSEGFFVEEHPDVHPMFVAEIGHHVVAEGMAQLERPSLKGEPCDSGFWRDVRDALAACHDPIDRAVYCGRIFFPQCGCLVQSKPIAVLADEITDQGKNDGIGFEHILIALLSNGVEKLHAILLLLKEILAPTVDLHVRRPDTGKQMPYMHEFPLAFVERCLHRTLGLLVDQREIGIRKVWIHGFEKFEKTQRLRDVPKMSAGIIEDECRDLENMALFDPVVINADWFRGRNDPVRHD